MSDVGDVAQAITWIGRLVYESLHPSKRVLINKAYEKAEKDVEDFCKELLGIANGEDGARSRAQLMLDGLVFGIKINITAGDAEQLRSVQVGNELDMYDLLGLYARSRGAEFCQEVNQIAALEDKVL